MATAAQTKANRENAQKSPGPTSEAGKQASSMNNFRHGLTGHGFFFLEWEDPENFDALKEAFKAEYQPQTATEHILIEKMAQHHWLTQRALMLQTSEMKQDEFDPETQKAVANFARYQTTHDRLFQRALHDLLKLRAERRKQQIGFESQKRAQAQEQRRENEENRKAERHSNRMAIDKERLEREKTANFLKAAKLAEELERVLPPEMLREAA